MGLETAILLEQFHSRLQKCQSEVDGKPWFTGGIDALAKELLFMAPKAIRQTMKRLVKSFGSGLSTTNFGVTVSLPRFTRKNLC